jgi:alpha-D-ribose 1-methylphosphonate 5-triphosphate synthase subunit PhnG
MRNSLFLTHCARLFEKPMSTFAFDQATYLGVLSRSPADEVKQLAEVIIPQLGSIEVLRNRTGLAMAPMQEGARGASFYLGEVLLAEAFVRVGAVEGYGACLGRDLEQALAIALIDAAVQSGIAQGELAAFVGSQAEALAALDRQLLTQAEATRVEIETF